MDNFTSMSLFAFGKPLDGGLIPNLIMQLAPDGSLEALAELLVEPTEDPNLFKPAAAIRLAPHQSDQFREVIAEKITDRVIGDILRLVKTNTHRASIRRKPQI